jgi:hypothetical protein
MGEVRAAQVACIAIQRVRALRTEVANRRFRSRLVYDPRGPALVLSPHHDDAVFNCWSVLDGPGDVAVVNVFAGIPRAGRLTEWDRISGARDSAERMRERLEEDRAALALADRTPINLPFVDLAYRRCAPAPSGPALDAAIAGAVPSCSALFAPIGAEHEAHSIVRRYAVAAAAAGVPVELYAEVPYITGMGWPDWVTGEPPDPHMDVRQYWSWNPAIPSAERGRAVALGETRSQRKLAAMRAYGTQFPAVDGGPVGRLSNPKVHGYEVFWPVRRAG